MKTLLMVLIAVLIDYTLLLSSNALTIVSADMTEHKFILEDKNEINSKQEIVLNPGDVISDICESGCTIYLRDGSRQIYGGQEMVLIKNGKLEIVK